MTWQDLTNISSSRKWIASLSNTANACQSPVNLEEYYLR